MFIAYVNKTTSAAFQSDLVWPSLGVLEELNT